MSVPLKGGNKTHRRTTMLTKKTLNWNIVYLEKCGYVELGKSDDGAPYIAPFVSLTAAGIDLVEDQVGFNNRFPLEEKETPDT